MTPLTLNLLAEEQQAERASAHDPVKYAIGIGIVIVALTAVSGMGLMALANRKAAEADRLQKQWDTLSAGQKSASFRMLKGFVEDLLAIHKKRYFLAPQMAQIKDLVPSAIYLSKMGFKVNVETAQGSAPLASPEATGGAKARVGKLQNVAQLTLRLEGAAIGSRPEMEVDSFLRVLRTNAVLSNQVKDVTLRSIGRATQTMEEDPQKIAAQFVIECLYKEVK